MLREETNLGSSNSFGELADAEDESGANFVNTIGAVFFELRGEVSGVGKPYFAGKINRSKDAI